MGFNQERLERTEQFRYDRFGMFIHWGIYAIPARGEWVRNREKISNEDYQKYFDAFDPVYYDPKKWARIAKNAGMKYVVLTTKHHDGFCLFDSQYTDYKATNTKAKRDLVREYVDAFRAEGLKIGFYYSLLDWHHPDYPHYGDAFHPMRDNENFKDTKHDFDNYITYLHNQVRELLTNYGKIDIMWFDFSYEKNEMFGEKWQATKLVEMVRSLQPGIIIDNRLDLHTNSYDDDNTPVFKGDFESPETTIPSKGIVNEKGEDVPWECCMTLNNHWGYCAKDKNYKTAEKVIKMLVECVSKGGNLLINIGPTAKGEFPKECVEILERVGEWMHENSDSIYGCTKSSVEKPEWGRFTQKGNKLYAHVYDLLVKELRIDGMGGRVKSARLLSDYSEIKLSRPWYDNEKYANDAFIEFENINELPDDIDTVIELELFE